MICDLSVVRGVPAGAVSPMDQEYFLLNCKNLKQMSSQAKKKKK